jgi:hypothetical protein
LKRKKSIGLSLVTAAWLGSFAFIALAASSIATATIPPVQLRQGLTIDVIRRDRDLLKIASNWPTDLLVENVSDRNVSGFSITAFASDQEGGPGRYIRWGSHPLFSKQDPLFKPGETRTVPIDPEVVRAFEENNQANDRPVIVLQLADVWMDNDPETQYRYGALMKRDPANPRRYFVVVDDRGRNIVYDASGKPKVERLSNEH